MSPTIKVQYYISHNAAIAESDIVSSYTLREIEDEISGQMCDLVGCDNQTILQVIEGIVDSFCDDIVDIEVTITMHLK
jgi:hypothetical protein